MSWHVMRINLAPEWWDAVLLPYQDDIESFIADVGEEYGPAHQLLLNIALNSDLREISIYLVCHKYMSRSYAK